MSEPKNKDELDYLYADKLEFQEVHFQKNTAAAEYKKHVRRSKALLILPAILTGILAYAGYSYDAKFAGGMMAAVSIQIVGFILLRSERL